MAEVLPVAASGEDAYAEQPTLQWLEELGWEVEHGPDLGPEGSAPERETWRDVVLIELGDGLRVVRLELVVGNLVHPRAHRLAEQLAARLAADRVGDRTHGIGRVDEAQRHRRGR